MDFLFTIIEWALGGSFGKKIARWARRALFVVLLVLAYCAPTRDILWIANAVGQWKIAPFIHAFEQTYHVRITSR
jgi:hypothetical protein